MPAVTNFTMHESVAHACAAVWMPWAQRLGWVGVSFQRAADDAQPLSHRIDRYATCAAAAHTSEASKVAERPDDATRSVNPCPRVNFSPHAELQCMPLHMQRALENRASYRVALPALLTQR